MNKRKANYELLRIVCMFMIVVMHGLQNTGGLHDAEDLGLINNISWAIEAFCIVAVNCFFLLTGYFNCEQKFRIEKVIEIWVKMILYSAVIELVCMGVGIKAFSVGDIVRAMLPFTFKRWWFVSVYIVLYLISPLLNILINKLTKSQFIFCLIVFSSFFSLQQTFIPVRYSLDSTQGYGICWGIVLYFVGAYLKKYGYWGKWSWAGMYFVFSLAIFATEWIIMRFGIASGAESRANFYAYNSLSVFLSSVCIFCFFGKIGSSISEKASRAICMVSKTTFGIYLLHAHPSLFNNLWSQILNINYRDSYYFVEIILASILVFVVCALIDMIYGFLCGGHMKQLANSQVVMKVNRVWN